MDPQQLLTYALAAQERADNAQAILDFCREAMDAAEARGDLVDAAAWSAEAVVRRQERDTMRKLAEACRADYIALTVSAEDRAE